MSTKKTLTEYLGPIEDAKVLEEDRTKLPKGVLMRVSGLSQAEGIKNKNGRIYGEDVWNATFGDKEWQERLASRGLLSELDHPEDGGRLRRVSHLPTRLERREMGGKKVIYGEYDILDTPEGRIAATLFRAGARVGISSRGEGTVEHDDEQGADIVKSDFRPEAFDFVSKPSTYVPGVGGAFASMLSESEQAAVDERLLSSLEALAHGTGDKRTLLACLRVLENYRGRDRGKQLLEEIESRLTGEDISNDTNDTAASAVEEKEPDMDEKQRLEEAKAQKELLEMARGLAAEKIGELKAQHSEETSQLQKTVSEQAARIEDFSRKMQAAEQIIEAFQKKVGEIKGTPSSKEQRLETELGAAKKIIESCIKALSRARGLKRYAKAAEATLQALIDKSRSTVVESYLARALAGVKDKETRANVLKLIGKPKTVKEAEERVKSLESLIKAPPSVRAPREPLPGAKGSSKSVRESQQPRQPQAPAKTIATGLWNRVAKRSK